jgi:hypothetical protein
MRPRRLVVVVAVGALVGGSAKRARATAIGDG